MAINLRIWTPPILLAKYLPICITLACLDRLETTWSAILSYLYILNYKHVVLSLLVQYLAYMQQVKPQQTSTWASHILLAKQLPYLENTTIAWKSNFFTCTWHKTYWVILWTTCKIPTIFGKPCNNLTTHQQPTKYFYDLLALFVVLLGSYQT